MSATSINITCQICQKSFSRPENLARHVRGVHTNETQYQCLQCQKRFTRSDLLRKHRKTHVHSRSHAGSSVESQSDNFSSAEAVLPSHVSAGRATSERVSNVDIAVQQNDDGVQAFDTPSHLSMQFPMAAVDANGNAPWDNGPSHGEGPFDIDLAWTFDYIMTRPDGTLHDMASHQIPYAYSNAEEAHTVNSLGTNDSRSDWPDGQSRSESPSQGQVTPSYLDSRFVDVDEINRTTHEHNLLHSRYCTISPRAARAIFELVTAEQLAGFCGQQPAPDEFPETATLQHFLLLYFVHVNPRFPVTHLPTFSPDRCFPDMLLAMILAGSCHSDSNQYALCHAYMERARMSVTLQRERHGNHLKTSDHIFTLFLLSLTSIWSGRTEAYRRAETDRGVLISAGRRSRLLDCRTIKQSDQGATISSGRERLNNQWIRWIEAERRKRLGLSIYIFDCQFAALLQRQPYISKAETVNTALPCDSVYWEAPTAQAWKLSLGPADIPPSTYHLPTLSSILLGKELIDTMYFPPLDSFSRLFYVYVVHTHIFEWRQAVCMLNSTGLRDTPVSFAPEQLGEGLLDRQRWLLGALTTWSEVYGAVPTIDLRSTAQQMGARLLYHLGYLALTINFADLYVVAGRSGSHEDIELATESIRNRLSVDKSHSILDHAFQMLDAALEVVQMPAVRQCSFEVAVCLFMGGLTCWAVRNVPQQPELNACLVWLQQHHSVGERRFSQTMNATADGQSVLIQKTEYVITALKGLRFLGFASIFASVLEKLNYDRP